MFEGMHPNVVVVVLFSCFSILQCRQSHESRPSKRKFIQNWVINYKPDMKVRISGVLLYSWLAHLLWNLLGQFSNTMKFTLYLFCSNCMGYILHTPNGINRI